MAVFLGYLRQLHQIDQTYARRMLDDKAPDAAEAKAFTTLVANVMDGALMQLGTHQGIRRTLPAPEATVEPRKAAPELAQSASAGQ